MASSNETKKFLDEKFKKLTEEGYSGPQRTAIALSIARKKGYNIPVKDKFKRKK